MSNEYNMPSITQDGHEWIRVVDHLALAEKAVEAERERIENVFKQHVPPHSLTLEDGVWLKRLLNKAFGHDKKDN